MNFALPTIAIVLAIIPGVVLRNSYFSARFPKQAFETTAVSELAHYLVFSIPIDLAALGCFQRWHSPGIGLENLLRIYLGQWSDSSISNLAEAVKSHGVGFSLFYMAIIVASYASGKIFQHLVWATRFDVYMSPLRMRHDWYYKLYGRLRDTPRPLIPCADVLATHPTEGTRLYTGVVSSFEATGDGNIKELVLVGARRGKGRGKEFDWVDIESSQFIVLGHTIHSINMRYVLIEPPKNRRKRMRWKCEIFFRSLLFGEP